MIGGRLAVRAVIAGLLCLGLAGCSGDDDPAPPSSTVTTTTADPIPSSVLPTAPVRPSDEATPESAEDFVKYFWQTYNYAYATYDTNPLKAMSALSCKFCAWLIADVKQAEADQARFTGYQLTVVESVSPAQEITTTTVVISTLTQQPGTAVAGGKTEELPGFKSARSTSSLTWTGNRWTIAGVSLDPKTREKWGG